MTKTTIKSLLVAALLGTFAAASFAQVPSSTAHEHGATSRHHHKHHGHHHRHKHHGARAAHAR